MLRRRVDQSTNVTSAVLEVPRMKRFGFGVMGVDAADRIVSFLKSPRIRRHSRQPDVALRPHEEVSADLFELVFSSSG